MIKSNELRCGNLVWDNYGGIYKVVNINSEGFDYIDAVKPSFKAIGRYELQSIEPIPLTEDWLKRFGFEKGNWLYSSGYCIQILKTDFYLRPCYLGGFYWGFNMDRKKNDCELNDAQPIQYVHQLQNLYFALTQTELTQTDGGKI